MSGLEFRYFVLKPRGDSPHAAASRAAMFRYAGHIRRREPDLARELWDWAAAEHGRAHNGEEPPADVAPPQLAPDGCAAFQYVNSEAGIVDVSLLDTVLSEAVDEATARAKDAEEFLRIAREAQERADALAALRTRMALGGP